MLPDCSKFPKRNVQTYGYVFHDINGQNHGTKWRSCGTSCTVINLNPMKLYKNLDGGNDESGMYVGSSEIMVKIFLQKVHRNVRITNICWSNWKITRVEKTWRKDGCAVLWYGRTCSKNALRDSVNWQTKWRNCRQTWMTINSNRRNLNQLEDYQKYAPKLSWNACICHEFVDLTFFGQWTNLLDRSRNGHEQVTDVTCSRFMGCADGSMTFIEQYQNTNQPSNMKLFAEWQIQTQTIGKPRCWSIIACGPRHHKRKFFAR